MKKLLTFLNTKLGLWLIGIIFGCIIYPSAQFFKDQFIQSIKRAERIELIDSEMKGRINQLVSGINRTIDSTKTNNPQSAKYEIKAIWFSFKMAPSEVTNGTNIFNDELKDRSTLSILNELKKLLKVPEEKKQINQVIEIIQTNEIVPTQNLYTNEDVDHLKKSIIDRIKIERWW